MARKRHCRRAETLRKVQAGGLEQGNEGRGQAEKRRQVEPEGEKEEMSMVEMKTTYEGIEIAYDEKANVWRFELRNRQRSAESLAKAKEAIDKPSPEPKKQFRRVKAWATEGYSDNRYELVDVTSVADGSRVSRTLEVWISTKDGRKKKYVSNCFPSNEANDKIVASIKELSGQIDALVEQRRTLQRELQPLKIEEEE